MLNRVRKKLTILYLILAIVLALVVGGGTYSLVSFFFQSTNDQALKVKMGLQFAAYNLPIPTELYEAVRTAGLVITQSPKSTQQALNENQLSPEDEENELFEHSVYESEYADIYVLQLSKEGDKVTGFNSQQTIVPADINALQSAIQKGSDLRTVRTANGVPVRILTYYVPGNEGVEVFQVGRYLASQQAIMRQLLNTMILLGGIITIGFGFASWHLAGQTLRPTQQAWDRQQTFIANASHELRTPLSLIHAGVEVGLRHVESDQQKQLLSDVLDDANYMKKLIEELLLLSRLDSHELKLEISRINLADFLPEILRQVERLAQKFQISLEQDITSEWIMADPVRLKQVLLILFDNAIRNNHINGWVRISTTMVKNQTRITISDSGKGIPPELLDRVFDRFYKVENGSSSEYQGSGLGLSIAKSLIEAQNGKIDLISIQNQGTEVILTLPND